MTFALYLSFFVSIAFSLVPQIYYSFDDSNYEHRYHDGFDCHASNVTGYLLVTDEVNPILAANDWALRVGYLPLYASGIESFLFATARSTGTSIQFWAFLTGLSTSEVYFPADWVRLPLSMISSYGFSLRYQTTRLPGPIFAVRPQFCLYNSTCYDLAFDDMSQYVESHLLTGTWRRLTWRLQSPLPGDNIDDGTELTFYDNGVETSSVQVNSSMQMMFDDANHIRFGPNILYIVYSGFVIDEFLMTKDPMSASELTNVEKTTIHTCMPTASPTEASSAAPSAAPFVVTSTTAAHHTSSAGSTAATDRTPFATRPPTIGADDRIAESDETLIGMPLSMGIATVITATALLFCALIFLFLLLRQRVCNSNAKKSKRRSRSGSGGGGGRRSRSRSAGSGRASRPVSELWLAPQQQPPPALSLYPISVSPPYIQQQQQHLANNGNIYSNATPLNNSMYGQMRLVRTDLYTPAPMQ